MPDLFERDKTLKNALLRMLRTLAANAEKVRKPVWAAGFPSGCDDVFL